MRREFNVLALVKGDERYVYVYDDESREPLLAFFRAQAADPELSLNGFDAAVLTQKAHEQALIGMQKSECGMRNEEKSRF
jgi:hypothetical protein